MDLHYLQLSILKKLLFAQELKFSELRPDKSIENNKLNFHIDQLVKLKYIQKNPNGSYSLTKLGKEFANRMETETVQMRKQGKIGVIPCCYKKEGKDYYFLIHTRLKQPFYGAKGFPSGKVWYGETTKEGAIRELKEESNLETTNDPEIFFIRHYRVFDQETNKLLEDKYFFFYRFENPKGELKSNEEGEFNWIKESDLKAFIDKTYETAERIIEIAKMCKNKELPLKYDESNHIADNF